ncbi:MAG TPA: hypothetical protein VIY27_08830 [Myxococcota bacterium]
MLGRSPRILAIYALGVPILGGWSALQLMRGVAREDLALVIVLPLAWPFGFFPIVTPLLIAIRMRAIQKLVEQAHQRMQAGVPPSEEQVAELADYFTRLAASENAIPEFLARRLVRKAIALILQEQSRQVAAGA